jgi:hypothetical protein
MYCAPLDCTTLYCILYCTVLYSNVLSNNIGIEALSLMQQYGADSEEKEEKEKETQELSKTKNHTVRLRLGKGQGLRQGQGQRQEGKKRVGQGVGDRTGVTKRKSSTPSRRPSNTSDSWDHRSHAALSLSLLNASPHMIAPLIAAAELKHTEKQGVWVIQW